MQHRFKGYALLLLVLIFISSLPACWCGPDAGPPGPDLQWSRTFGSGDEVYGSSVQQTTDGGYIVCGRIYSIETHMEGGIWLIKADAEGNKLWDKTFNLSGNSAFGESVQQTTDGGYVICGTTVTDEANAFCIWLIKTDPEGNKTWDKTFAPSSKWGYGAWGYSVQQTTDGGYILGGRSDDHLRLIKTDAEGNATWDKMFVGQEMAIADSVQQTTDGGYIVCGNTWPPEEDSPISRSNIWLIKTDADGNKVWDKTFGGQLYARGHSVQQTTDGGYIVCGTGDTEKTIGNFGALLIKTDAQGNKLWDKIFNTNGGHSWSVQQTPDGGYIVCGTSHDNDAWLIKTDAEGNKLWDKAFGKEIEGSSGGQSIQQTTDGGYIICGWSSDADSDHVLLLKIPPEQ